MFNRISQLLKWGVARFSGAQLVQPDGVLVAFPRVLSFPDFTPSILASFVVGSTASQSGTTVTVTAPGHNIVGSNQKDGYRIYYPGSPSIPAGWYDGFARVNVDTITFQRATATVASEPVNGGEAFISALDIFSLTLPGGTLSAGSRAAVVVTRRAGTTGAVKTVRVAYGSTQLSADTATSTPNFVSHRLGFVCTSVNSQVGMIGGEGRPSGASQYVGAVNSAVAQPITFAAQISAAADFICIDALALEIA